MSEMLFEGGEPLAGAARSMRTHESRDVYRGTIGHTRNGYNAGASIVLTPKRERTVTKRSSKPIGASVTEMKVSSRYG